MAKIMILVDYKNDFLISIDDLVNYKSMNVSRIRDLLTGYGHLVEIIRYSELDFGREFNGYYVLYQTAEDPGVFYKNYIKDIIYYLECQGAIMMPKFSLFLAHHNKNFMELLRNDFIDEGLKTIESHLYGTAEEAISQIHDFPVVIKSAEGAGSSGVFLARDRKEFEKITKKISNIYVEISSLSIRDYIVWRYFLNIVKRIRPNYKYYSFNRRKFIVQNFIEGLKGDYKVLYFDGKYYSIYRENRNEDFRASGSGKFYPVDDAQIPNLLNFAQRLINEVDFPIIGMDIGFDGQIYHLFEFQFIHLGPYALQASESWFEYDHGAWVKKFGKSNLEEEFCRSINSYIRNKEDINNSSEKNMNMI